MDLAAIAEKCRPATCLYSRGITVVGATIRYPPGHDLPRNPTPTPTRHRKSELADRKPRCLRDLSSRSVAMIRIDAIWLATEPVDMRAGTETALARVIAVFGAAKAHCAYLFANHRGNRMKVLVHDGVGIWLVARRLN
jgi:transposase